MDVIALAAAEFEHAVAPLGTAVTEEQLALMWRMADEPVINAGHLNIQKPQTSASMQVALPGDKTISVDFESGVKSPFPARRSYRERRMSRQRLGRRWSHGRTAGSVRSTGECDSYERITVFTD